MEHSQEYSQLPKQLQLYYARIQNIHYPTAMSTFCIKVKEFYRLLEEKYKSQENFLEKITFLRISAEMVALKEAIRVADTTFNDRNLELLCRYLVAQEPSNDVMTQFIIVNLNAILYKVDHGEVTIHVRSTRTHEIIAQQLETTQQELQKKTESVKILEASVKNRDDVWQKAFEQLKAHYELAQQSSQEIFSKTLDQLMEQHASMQQNHYQSKEKSYEDMLQRLDAKDQQIALLAEQNALLLKCVFQLENASKVASPKSPLKEGDSHIREGTPNKISQALGQSLANGLRIGTKQCAKKLDFSIEQDNSLESSKYQAPDFDELTQRFEIIKTT